MSAHENPDTDWYVWELWFDRGSKDASIVNPDTGTRMDLPRQDRIVEGFCRHDCCDFSAELSSYLRYLQTYHLLLFREVPEFEQVTDNEAAEINDLDWDDDSSFSYHNLLFRIPPDTNARPYFGFDFIDDQLYSSVYMTVVEFD